MTEEELAALAAKQAAEAKAAEEAKAKTDADAKAAAEAKAKEEADAKAKADAAKTGPSDAEAKLLKEVMKLKDAAKAAEERLKSYEGLDPVKMRELIAAQEAAERAELEKKGEYDRLVKQMAERHAADKKSIEDKLLEKDGTVKTLTQQIAELTVGTAFAQSKFIKEDLTPATAKKARVLFGSHFEFKDGAVVGYDKPAGASDRTMLVNAAGDALGFEDAMRKIIEADPDKDDLLASKQRPGAGSKTTPGARQSRTEKKDDTISSVDRISRGLKALAKKP